MTLEICTQAHPEDVTGDKCVLCNRGDEQATDWVSCDRCGSWVHFSCDTRPDLGAFKVGPCLNPALALGRALALQRGNTTETCWTLQ